MSSREIAKSIIDNIPEEKLSFIINILNDIQGYANEPVMPDKWDLQMIEEANKINNGSTICLQDAKKELGIDL